MREEKRNRKVNTFAVPFSLGEIKNNITINTSKASREKIINQALRFHSEGNILEASKYYQHFINRGFQDHRIFSNYGLILQGLGKLKEAEIITRKGIELNPNFAKAHFILGNILIDLGNLKEAEHSYRRAIELNPNFAKAHLNLGSVLRDLSKLKDAELSMRKAIKLNPNLTNAHYNLGNILSDLGNLKDAELSQRKAIEMNPNFTDAYYTLGNTMRGLGKLKEAEFYTRKAIELNPNFADAYHNLSGIFINIGKLKEAEFYTRKAIELNPNFAEAHSNLGSILQDSGNSKEAELSTRKAISLNPNLAKAYFTLSTLNPSSNNKIWKNKLFSESILSNQTIYNLIDIYFARANILEKNCDFKKASNNLKKANNLNRTIYGSNYSLIKKNINTFSQDWEENKNNVKQLRNLPIPIFIVGMPRSGKTIIESILACNSKLIKYGESFALEKAIKLYIANKENSLNKNLSKIYFEYIEANHLRKSFISTTTPMNLIYTGLTISQISTAKFIFCYRNPLDNILEIYKKNLGNKQTYSSSIIETTNLWIECYSLMEKYKRKYDSNIYFLNYEKLVTNTEEEIKHLLGWLGWNYDKKYLKPSLDPTTIKITSCLNSKIINKNEISIWKNYKNILNPAINIFNSNTKFKSLLNKAI